ncbi:MAG: FAD-binding protein [Chromatiales bacterium]|nr:FAD-binding protein [Chromatiales bacterium]
MMRARHPRCPERLRLATDVLVIGAGGAGMYAALAAARAGARVVLADKNMIGRGGATVMAQMTVAAALAEQEPDTWEDHLADTLAAGRGLCDEPLAEVLCRNAPARMREMDGWGVGWARANGHIRQVTAPGHGRRRCCYVDFLNTGPAVAGTLRKRVGRTDAIRALSNVAITDLVVKDGSVRGALALSLGDGAALEIEAAAAVIATGGLTKLYSRSSASNNMAGEGYALALQVGAALVDMEFVQFFPIGHLAPRLVGMDPIMWDPFRYKLGGRLLNGAMEEFIDRYGGEDGGRYTATRDLATYAICREVEAGRGSPSGGAWLSFTHLPEAELRDAFGPVIDRLLGNGIDLTRAPIEVAPIAHYHMGGVKVDSRMRSTVAGLYAAGEAVGGAAGANRLSGNAISEALVYGEIAGREAARHAEGHAQGWDARAAEAARTAAEPSTGTTGTGRSAVALVQELRRLMWKQVGPFRDRGGLASALERIRAMRDDDLPRVPVPSDTAFAIELADRQELRSALLVAEAVAVAALAREESRGAHQRDDFPDTSTRFRSNQEILERSGALVSRFVPVAGQGFAA